MSQPWLCFHSVKREEQITSPDPNPSHLYSYLTKTVWAQVHVRRALKCYVINTLFCATCTASNSTITTPPLVRLCFCVTLSLSEKEKSASLNGADYSFLRCEGVLFCFLLLGGFHLCTIMWMKVSLKPQWTSISLCHLPPCPSPTASSPSLPLLIRGAHTCGGPAALSNSRQRPQTGWLQITFKSKKKKYGRDRVGGRKLSIHC